MKGFIDAEAREDFNKARLQEFFSRLSGLFLPDRSELLSLNEIREVLRPKSETYRGMTTVPVDKIVGSEGRYRDFNKHFLPKHEHLRHRWENVDKAHLKDVILPPIKLYEVGGVYFVRDGNHRVSVARTQGVKDIDAEVTLLDTEIPLGNTLTRKELQSAVIQHEKEWFYKRTRFTKYVDYDLNFTAPGRYEEVLNHIYGHKYFLNEHETVEIPLEKAIVSWFNNVFMPIVQVIEEERLMARFPGRTSADLYLWIVKHWDQLKRECGQDFPISRAVQDYTSQYGRSMWQRLRAWVKKSWTRFRGSRRNSSGT